ncbi:MAG: hypothetical protein WED34_10125 [Planctomycetales bacterium]
MSHDTTDERFALCVRNAGYEADLDVGTIYVVLPDEEAATRGRIRIVDESGEDYLYPREYFTPVELSQPVRKSLSGV